MEAIFSSKLYRTSKHKDKIHSAIKDPLNVELVQQLKEYLDEPEKVEVSDKVDNQSTSSEEKSKVAEESSKDNESNTPSRISSSPIIHAEPSTDSKSEESETSETSETDSSKSESEPEKKVDKKSETEDVDRSRTFHSPKKPENKESSTESKVEESVTVESATVLYQQPIEAGHCCHGEFVDPDAIKGTLNVRDDTKGVSRIFIKDDELWIYYQDKINLNSVMEPVIAVLNGTGFTNLEFNRLARTENAIVFQISCVFNQIEPMNSENE